MSGLFSIKSPRRMDFDARRHRNVDPPWSAALWAMTSAALLGLSPGCSESGTTPSASVQSPSCTPNTRALCPCSGGGEGSQLCTASGDAYGPCEGCPPAAQEEDASPQVDASLPVKAQSDAGSPEPNAGQDARTEPDGEADSSSDATVAPNLAALDAAVALDAAFPERDAASDALDAAAKADAAAEPDASIGPLPPTPGTRCGVGLPATCALGTEKCCVRSLATDSCVNVEAPCSCDTPDCDTLEMHCDGPEDCSGGVCCGTLRTADAGEFFMCDANHYLEFTCQVSCQDSANQRVACHTQDPQCPQDTVCANSQLLSNLQVCVDPATIAQ